LGASTRLLTVAFQILGVVGRFNSSAFIIVIVVLMAQEIWTVAAAIAMVVRTPVAMKVA
jgi:hypothetical protein